MDKETARKLIKRIFQNSFNKDDFVYFIKSLLNHLEPAPFVYRGNFIPDAYEPYIKTLERIGKYQDEDDKKIELLIVHLKKEKSLERARTMQRNFIAWYLNGSRGDIMKDAALVAFVSPNSEDWRFSLVKMDYRFDDSGEKIKVKQELTPARRFSFLVGKTESSHTAQSSLVPILENDEKDPTLKDLEHAFSIERVTKEFFERYRQLFHEAKEALDEIVKKDEKVKKDFKEKNIDTINFTKKLLGQIVFLYFLQKKGWFGVERNQDWGTGPKNFLRLLFEKGVVQYDNFFNEILEPLFYEALRHDRSSDDHYFSYFNCKIPFLNGGLFDPINDYDWSKTDIILPNELFSNNEKTKQGDIGTGILDIFDRYNFTVKEDEPLEKEVAVDPEMLGKVFENLLEVKDRKSKGTYYTPREIVHYMCQQSLINYLATELKGKNKQLKKLYLNETDTNKKQEYKAQIEELIKIKREDIETLVKYGEAVVEHDSRVVKEGKETKTYSFKLPKSIRDNAKLIDEKLETIRVCDPAVGSGAFPVGMMNEVVRTRNALSNYIKDKKDGTIYDFKRHAIQNCLYGVDIDLGAVEIAKLRLWLSLIVDEEDIKQIKPLPNLDYKIVCGNSLLGVEKNLFNADLFSKLEELKPLFFNETNTGKKQEYKKQIDELINQITNGRKDFDFEIYFSEVFHKKKGFDVVIANPPYVRQEKIKDQKPLLQSYKLYNATSDLYVYFYERGYNLLKDVGILTFISSNKWMRAKYGEKLRRFFKEKTRILQLVDFNGYKVFEATVDTNIIIFQKESTPSVYRVPFVNIKSDFIGESLSLYLSEHQQSIPLNQLNNNGWSLVDKQTLKLKQKIEKIGIPLKDWDVKIYRGVLTGFNKAFIIDTETKEKLCKEDPKSAEVIKPILRGRDIGRYYYRWVGLWIIKIESGWTNKNCGKIKPEEFFKNEYPAIYNHLIPFKNFKGKGKGLINRDDQGDYWWELRDCAYYPEFEKEKIVWAEMTDDPAFINDNRGFYTNQTAYIATGEDIKYIIAFLNSKADHFYLKQIAYSLGENASRWIKQYVEQLPVPKIPGPAQQPFITLVDQILSITKDVDYLQNPSKQTQVKEYEQKIDQLVYKLYGLTKEEIKIVDNHE